MVEIRDIHATSRRTYGAPRVHGQLRRRGLVVNHKRVERLMRTNELCGVSNRRRWRRNNPGAVPGEDLVARDFTAAQPDRRWVADITELACGDGRLYLAGIMDLYSRRIVGWSIGDRRPAGLAVDASVMALERRQPAGGVIHHADMGRSTRRRHCATQPMTLGWCCRMERSGRVMTTLRWKRSGRR